MALIRRILHTILAPILCYRTYGRWHIKGVFNDWYEGHAKSPALRAIFRDVYGDDYASDVDPTGFSTLADLKNIVTGIELEEDKTLVDLGCGRGGPGLWVARETKANLIGIDISDVAIDHAKARASEFSLPQEVEFYLGDFAATGLPDACCDAAMSVDALLFAPDKAAAMREAARILRPGARFAFTSWEIPSPLDTEDYRWLVNHAGLELETYEETADWAERQRAVYDRILASREVLTQEMGAHGARPIIREAERAPAYIDSMRRIFVVARKK